MASKFNFGKRLRVTGHEYRKMDYGAALRCGCSCENRFVSKRWHPSFKATCVRPASFRSVTPPVWPPGARDFFLQAFTRRHVPCATSWLMTGTIVVPAFSRVEWCHAGPDQTSRSGAIPENAWTQILTDRQTWPGQLFFTDPGPAPQILDGGGGQLVQKRGPWRKGPVFKWAYFLLCKIFAIVF